MAFTCWFAVSSIEAQGPDHGGHGDVSQAMEAVYAQAVQLLLLLSRQACSDRRTLLLAHALMDDIDEMRALHVRVVMDGLAA